MGIYSSFGTGKGTDYVVDLGPGVNSSGSILSNFTINKTVSSALWNTINTTYGTANWLTDPYLQVGFLAFTTDGASYANEIVSTVVADATSAASNTGYGSALTGALSGSATKGQYTNLAGNTLAYASYTAASLSGNAWETLDTSTYFSQFSGPISSALGSTVALNYYGTDGSSGYSTPNIKTLYIDSVAGSISTTAVPEPSTNTLIVVAVLLGTLLYFRRRSEA